MYQQQQQKSLRCKIYKQSWNYLVDQTISPSIIYIWFVANLKKKSYSNYFIQNVSYYLIAKWFSCYSVSVWGYMGSLW